MRRLLVSLLALFAILFAIDRVGGAALARLFRTTPALEDGDTMRRAWLAHPAVVVCGSSRAMHHYAADSLSAELGEPAWNLGRDGMGDPLYQYAAAGIVLRHARPRLWIIEADGAMLRGPELTGRLACFLPYVDDEPAAREVVALRSRCEPVRLCSRIYRYNSLLLSMLSPALGKHPRARSGFLPLHGSGVGLSSAAAALGDTGSLPPIDSLKWRYLRRTVELLRSHGVEVVVTHSPVWLASASDRRSDEREVRDLEGAFGRLGVPCLDFSVRHDAAFGDARLFRDAAHLNEEGALLLTRMLADSLRARGLVPGALAADPPGR